MIEEKQDWKQILFSLMDLAIKQKSLSQNVNKVAEHDVKNEI